MHFGPGHFHLRFADESVKPKMSWPMVKRVLGYARPYALRIVLLLLLILAATGLGLLTPLVFRDLIDRAIPRGDVRLLTLLALALIAVPVANGVLHIIQARVSAAIGSGVIFDLRVGLYRTLHRMSLAFFTHNKTGELMSRLNNDVIGAQTAVSGTAVDIVTNIVTVAATLSVMVALEWRLTILGLLILPAFALVSRTLGKQMRKIAREQMERNAKMNAIMNETLNISGLLLVKLFGTGEREVSRFSDHAAAVRENQIKQAMAGGRLFMFMGMATAVATGVIYLVGGRLAISGTFTVGTIVAFSSYLGQLYGPLRALTTAPVAFAQSMVSFERVFEVLDLPEEIRDKTDAVAPETVRGEIVFERVSFAYRVDPRQLLSEVKRIGNPDVRVLSGPRGEGGPPPGGEQGETPPAPFRRFPRDGAAATGEGAGGNGERAAAGDGGKGGATRAFATTPEREYALSDVSFRIEPGQIAALVGPSGAGKTTVTYLIPRLYDPTGGRILLDGRDLRDLRLATLSRHIGMVTQENYLFHDTLAMNLRYARPDATASEVEEACRAANIHDFIKGLPAGYETVVGERGYRLSGGEKQRVALARVILKDPRILVLDEATSHLDSRSEALVKEALARVMAGRTSLVIAHRLSTILAADIILVLDRGRIVEQGRHAELVGRDGLYAELYRTQFQEAER